MVTLPGKANANAADNNPISSLTEDNTIQWRVVELDGTHEQNLAKVTAVATDEPYVKYVLQTNWDSTNQVTLKGVQAIIFDLNGYVLSFKSANFLTTLWTEFFEITDSSVAGNGFIYNVFTGAGTINLGQVKKTVIFSGGSMRGYTQAISGKDFVITGGNLIGDYKNSPPVPTNNNIYYADYVTKTTDSNGLVSYRSDANGTTYAVSASNNDIVTGLYNYEFSTRTWLVKQSCLLEKSLGGQALLWQYTNQSEWQYLGVMDETWYKILPLH